MAAKTPSDLRPVFTSADVRRERIRDKAVQGIKDVFPFVGRRYTVAVSNVNVKPAEYGPDDYKKAILGARSLAEPVRGTVKLIDNQSGKVVQEKRDFTLMQLPHLTAHDNFVIRGNRYSVSNQLRMKPGVYSRKKRNEELEAQFNTHGGPSFRVSMDPVKGQFNMEFGASKIPLYPVLRKMGLSDSQIARKWNPQLVRENKAAFGEKQDAYFKKLYEKTVHPGQRRAGEDTVEAVRKAHDRAKLDPDTTKKTLGTSFDRVTPDAILEASGRLLQAYNSGEDFDERDNLAFKKLLGPDDFIKERIQLDARDLQRKALSRLDYGATPDIQRALGTSPFSRGIRRFLSTSALSGNPAQINPVEIIDSAVRVTSMGEGGIASDRAVPDEARRLHPTHAAIIDPVRTPESHRAGIDVRTSLFTATDSEGNIFTPLQRGKHIEYVPIAEAAEASIAFPGASKHGKRDVLEGGRIRSMNKEDVKYRIPTHHAMYSMSTNLIPFLDSIDGNRATMGSKMMTQALPLKGGEAPMIQVSSYRPGRSMEEEVGAMVVPTAPVSGTVMSIRDGYVHIKPDTPTKTGAPPTKVPYFTDFPLASKTYLNDTLTVSRGQKVKAGQPLAESHYAKDGQLSMGRNLRVAYTSMRGMNSNDAVVVSENAANKLTSLHMYQEGTEVDSESLVNSKIHANYYGNKYAPDLYNKLGDDGVVKPGMRVNPGDLLIASVQKSKLTPEARMLGKLHKKLVKPYRDTGVTWEHDTPGVVTDVVRAGNKIRMTVKTEEPLKIGDKLAGRYGNKGVVSAIIPDDQMLQDENGNPIDMAVSPTSVVTRINPAQVLETALARVAEKTGKRIIIENFADRDNVAYVKAELKKHGLKDTETITDPQTGKKISGVLVGPQFTQKLMKTTATNFSARGVDDYDVNQQPSAGGPKGAKGIGRMEFNALVAHDARNVVQETAALRSQRNDAWWRAHQLGLPTPALRTPFAYDKFGAMLAGAGIKMDKRGNHVQVGPLTDKDVEAVTSGAIKRPLFVKAKDLTPEQGGFFDPALTGGNNGTKWSHVELSEPMVNPIFERPVRTFLGMKQKELEEVIQAEGGAGVQKRLSKIDLDQRETETLAKLKKLKADKRNNAVKELKYIRALKENGMRPEDAYVVSKVPVVPPVYRPIVPGTGGNLQISDPNYLLRDTMIANDLVRKTKGLPPDMQRDARKHLYESMGALYGVSEPTSPQLQGRNVQGYIARISGAGRSPKSGFFHGKLLKRRQDVSGRGTIAPDATLAMDEVGLPEDAGWSMYAPFVMKDLVRRGFRATEAKTMIEDRHPTARASLVRETGERPLFVNRAPSLYRYNMLAAYPKLVPGKTIRVHESLAPIQAGDFDGDAVSLTVPVTAQAVEEAKRLTLPNMLLSDQRKFTLTKAAPQQEAVMGVYQATSASPTGQARVFNNQADAMTAYHRGEITLGTPVSFKGAAKSRKTRQATLWNPAAHTIEEPT